MLTFKDCIDFADLDEDMILAVAQSESLPSMVACELVQSLAQCAKGMDTIRKLTQEELVNHTRQIEQKDRSRKAASALAKFNRTHPRHSAPRSARIS